MSDITPADALRELRDDQAEYAAAAAKRSPTFEEFKAEKLKNPAIREAYLAAKDDPLVALVALRKMAGLTQRQVAERMDVTQSTVSGIESGALDVRLSTLRRYALAVGARIRTQIDIIPPEVTP